AILVKRDSVPPVNIGSNFPRTVDFYVLPLEFIPNANTVTEQEFSPLAHVCMESCQAATAAIKLVTKIGLTRVHHLYITLVVCFSYVSIPPIPQPIHTPTRSAFSSVIFNPESFNAISEAATAYCANRSIFLASFFSI